MKRTVRFVVGLAALGVAVGVGAYLSAQQPGGTLPQPGTQPVSMARPRVAVVNLSHVVKNYDKWKGFQDQYKADYKLIYEDKVTQKKTLHDQYKAAAQNPKTAPADKEKYDEQVRKLAREITDISEEAQRALGKREADMIVTIYKEIEDAVRDFSRAAAIELVMHYNDAVGEPERSSAPNVHRKVSMGGCVPFYASPGVDISNSILDILNRRYRAAAPAPGAGTVVPVGGTQPQPPVQPRKP